MFKKKKEIPSPPPFALESWDWLGKESLKLPSWLQAWSVFSIGRYHSHFPVKRTVKRLTPIEYYQRSYGWLLDFPKSYTAFMSEYFFRGLTISDALSFLFLDAQISGAGIPDNLSSFCDLVCRNLDSVYFKHSFPFKLSYASVVVPSYHQLAISTNTPPSYLHSDISMVCTWFVNYYVNPLSGGDSFPFDLVGGN